MFEEARERLKAACVQVRSLTTQIRKMEEAMSRADKSADDAKAELGKHSSLDRDISKWRVEQVKKDASTKILPGNLKARLDARRAAEDELEQAEATRADIKTELTKLGKRMNPAEQERLECASDLLREHGAPLVEELQTLNARRTELIQILDGLGSTSYAGSGRHSSIGYTESMRDAIYETSDIVCELSGVSLLEGMQERWRNRMATLLNDPDAQITIPGIITPSDYELIPPSQRAGITSVHFGKVYRLRAEN